MARLFNLPNVSRPTKQSESTLLSKAKRLAPPPPRVIRGRDSLMDRIKTVKALVDSKLGKFADEVETVRNISRLEAYIDRVCEIGECAIDTETTGLDPLTDVIVGFSLYTPGEKAIYVPLEHISYVTGVKVANQIPKNLVAQQLDRLRKSSHVNIIYHNAKYDYRMILNDLGVDMDIYWDTMIGAFMLNENERIGLKYVWELYCGAGETELAMNFEDMFKDLDFRYVPIETATLYAGMDPKKTYELYEFEKQFLNPEEEECKKRHLERVAWVFHNIEMPVIKTVARMEDRGIALDVEYAQELESEYTQRLKVAEDDFYRVLEMYRDQINDYKRRNPGSKFKEPVAIGSPLQLSLLFYDVLKLKGSGKTGESDLVALDHPLARKVLEYRGVQKLLSTYITKLPKVVNPRDKKIHCNFNQCGAQTGRFSSSDPNLQNIPSKDKKIRKMFIPDSGKYLVGDDFSQQEPRNLANITKEQGLLKIYKEGKDLYATLGSMIYHVPYEDCLEFFPDGTTNPEGKKRRSSMKPVVLGIMYERGPASLAESLGISLNEAKNIISSFFKSYPKVKEWIDASHEKVKKLGFVEDAFGRRRRLLDAQLPDYTFEVTGEVMSKNFDPLAMLNGDIAIQTEIDAETERSLRAELRNAYGWKAVNEVKKKAEGMGIKVHDNTGKIADALRQAVNFQIQGSAASQTKLAMIKVDNDPELNALGFELLLQVHDELIGQCPIENAKAAAARLSYIMKHACDGLLDVPFDCDASITDRWYGEEIAL